MKRKLNLDSQKLESGPSRSEYASLVHEADASIKAGAEFRPTVLARKHWSVFNDLRDCMRIPADRWDARVDAELLDMAASRAKRIKLSKETDKDMKSGAATFSRWMSPHDWNCYVDTYRMYLANRHNDPITRDEVHRCSINCEFIQASAFSPGKANRLNDNMMVCRASGKLHMCGVDKCRNSKVTTSYANIVEHNVCMFTGLKLNVDVVPVWEQEKAATQTWENEKAEVKSRAIGQRAATKQEKRAYDDTDIYGHGNRSYRGRRKTMPSFKIKGALPLPPEPPPPPDPEPTDEQKELISVMSDRDSVLKQTMARKKEAKFKHSTNEGDAHKFFSVYVNAANKTILPLLISKRADFSLTEDEFRQWIDACIRVKTFVKNDAVRPCYHLLVILLLMRYDNLECKEMIPYIDGLADRLPAYNTIKTTTSKTIIPNKLTKSIKLYKRKLC